MAQTGTSWRTSSSTSSAANCSTLIHSDSYHAEPRYIFRLPKFLLACFHIAAQQPSLHAIDQVWWQSVSLKPSA